MLEKREYGKLCETVWSDTLDNGLRLTVVSKPDFKKSMAFFAVNYGGSDREFFVGSDLRTTPAGIAHFLEHKMFDMEGEENALTILSGRGTSANAFTSSDMTAYHFECIDMFYENLETLLTFVSTPYFTEDSVNKERGIIGQEIRMVEDEPDYAVYYGLLKGLFKSNPVREPVAGSIESISQITADTLYELHHLFYTPSNMVLTVVGNQDPEKIRDMALRILPKEYSPVPKKYFGGKEKIKPNEPMTMQVMEVGAPLFLAGCKAMPDVWGYTGARYEITAALALSALMGQASPLYNSMYSKGIINETFSYDFEVTSGVSFFSFGGETENPELVAETVFKEAERLVKNGLPKDYFERRKKSAIGSSLRVLNSFESICYDTAVAGFYGYDYFGTFDMFSKITEDEVLDFLRRYLRPENMAISIVKGEREN